MKCPRCEYEWKPKIIKPKECPRCKARLDYTPGPVGAPKIGKKGGEKEMTSKLPWATVALIIVVVAAIGAWKIFANPTTPVTPTTGYATVTVGSTNVVFTGTIPTYSGIENIYIMDTESGYAKDSDLGTVTTGRMGTITGSGGTANIPYENSFDIVVAFKLRAPENAAYAAKENAHVELTASGGFTIGPENLPNDNMWTFASENSGTHYGWVRVNAIWDNGGNGYKLLADGSLSLSSVRLFGWGPSA
jgi:hypothetical protein